MAQTFEPSAQPQSTSRSDDAGNMGQRALDQGMEAAAAARDTVKEYPATTLAIIGGLAFAIGALWMVRRSRQPTLMDRLADLQDQIPRRWRSRIADLQEQMPRRWGG